MSEVLRYVKRFLGHDGGRLTILIARLLSRCIHPVYDVGESDLGLIGFLRHLDIRVLAIGRRCRFFSLQDYYGGLDDFGDNRHFADAHDVPSMHVAIYRDNLTSREFNYVCLMQARGRRGLVNIV